jgi:hypothetical protein
MSDMKSAYERAMERADRIGRASPEELQLMEAVSKGNQMAARFMKEPGFDLAKELDSFKNTGVMKQVVDAAMEILLRYLALPSATTSRDGITRAKQGILLLKSNNKKLVEQVFSQLDNMFNYYEQARQQAFNQLKQGFDQQPGRPTRGAPASRADVTGQAQFRDEWARVLGELDRQYEQVLEDQKQKLLKA